MIKVANFTASISRKNGGIFDAVLRLTQSHDREKFDERVYGLRDESTEVDLPRWAPVPAAAFAAEGLLKPVGYSPKFSAVLDEFAPDICHTHGLWLYPSAAVKAYGKKTGRPYLVSPHGMLDPWALQNSRWKKRIAWIWFEEAHLRGARCLRALCQAETEAIRKLGLKNEIAVIPNGIDLPRPDPAAPAPWRGMVEPGKKVLLFLSRIHPKKGLLNLLKAWASVRGENQGWVLAVVGWDQGGHEAELKQLCLDLGIAFSDLRDASAAASAKATVLFMGPLFNEAKAACYHHCDAFVLPSFSEGLPMVVLEAWANAKPVLMTPECNLPEGFQAGAALRMDATEPGTVSGLRELQTMSEEDRALMGQRARRLVEERFIWSQVAGQLESVYAWMLGGGVRPSAISDAC